MSTNASGTKESIDTRTRKAATESMTVVALDEAGEYKVYSGTRKSYVVDLIVETCECPDEEYNHPEDGCKHRQRVEMEIGGRPIPELDQRTDVEIMSGRSRETETRVATDGGAVVETTGETETDRPADCECIGEMDDAEIGCWPCWRDGFKTANPDAKDVIEAEAEELVAEMEAEARREGEQSR